MGTKNVHVENSLIEIGGEKFELRYTLASFAYLSEKYGDLGKVFALADSSGKNLNGLVSREFLGAVADMLYAGIMRPDPDALDAGKSFKDADTSGQSPGRLLVKIQISDIPNISKQISAAMTKAMPDADPTKAGASPAN